ncbi:MAG TPA: hypothetical protein VMH39_14390, partial [Gemmatimonadaceae bacterium]|nr:hypothetical protein [Gemmatimonadaceae bacterium]
VSPSADGGDAGAPDDADTDAATLDGAVASTDAGTATDAAPGNSDTTFPTLSTFGSIAIAGSFTTLLVAGEVTPAGSDPALVVAPLVDDSVLVSGGASLRAVNASASGVPQDFGFESADGGGFLSAFANVAFAHAAAESSPGEPPLDGNGYLTVGEQDAVAFGARASSDATADTVATQSLQIDLGAITTVMTIGGDVGGRQPSQFLFCVDNQPSGGPLSDCSILP